MLFKKKCKFIEKCKFWGRGNVVAMALLSLRNSHTYKTVLHINQFSINAVINVHCLMLIVCTLFDTGQLKVCTWSKMIDFFVRSLPIFYP